MRALVCFIAGGLGSACVAVPESDVAALEGPDVRVFRVPGLVGDRLVVRTFADTAEATRDGTELALVLPVGAEDRADVWVYDANGALLGAGQRWLTPVAGYQLEHVGAGSIDVTISNFAVRFDRFDHEANPGDRVRVRAAVTTPDGVPIDAGAPAWIVDGEAWLEVDADDPYDVKIATPLEAPVGLSLCVFDPIACWKAPVLPLNLAGVIRRTGWIQTTIGLGASAPIPITPNNHTIALWVLAQYPRGDEQVLISNGDFDVDGYTILVGSATSGPRPDHSVYLQIRRDHATGTTGTTGPTVRYPIENWYPRSGSPVWHHVAVTSYGTIAAYVDGVPLVAQGAGLLAPSSLSGAIQIGELPADAPGYRRQYYGLVDDVAVFSPHKSDDEIKALFRAKRLTGTELNLVTRESFDAGGGSFAAESWSTTVSDQRHDWLDTPRLPEPYQLARLELPFPVGEVWRVGQAFSADYSHRDGAAFALDIARVPYPATAGSWILAPAAATVIETGPLTPVDGVYSFLSVGGGTEYVAVMHLAELGQVSAGTALPAFGKVGRLHSIWLLDERRREYENSHLHLGFHGPDNHLPPGAPLHTNITVPMGFSDFRRSRDDGVSWEHVSFGALRDGDWVKR